MLSHEARTYIAENPGRYNRQYNCKWRRLLRLMDDFLSQ